MAVDLKCCDLRNENVMLRAEVALSLVRHPSHPLRQIFYVDASIDTSFNSHRHGLGCSIVSTATKQLDTV